jgi:hypothetical protein
MLSSIPLGYRLYAKERILVPCIGVIIALGAASWLWSDQLIGLPSLAGNDSRLIPVALIVPLCAAIAIGQSLRASMPELELLAARDIRVIRAAHIALLLGLSALVFVPGPLGWYGLSDQGLGIRNCLGYTGLCCISVPPLGARLSWGLPVTYALLTAVYASTSSEPTLPAWAWPVNASATPAGWTWVIALCAVGVLGAVTMHPRGASQGTAAD